MKKQSIVIAFCNSILISTLICAEPQLSYWQRFKNWIGGGAPQEQHITNTSLTKWAQNLVAQLTEEQKTALKMQLLPSKIQQPPQYLKVVNTSLYMSALRGFMVPYINHYAHSVNLKNTIEQIRIDLSDFHNFPKLNFKRDALFIMQTAFSPKGENPNAVALQAATIILNELLTEKERELEKIVTHISDKKKFPTMQSIITFLTNEQSRLSLEPTPDLIRLAAIESALWQANDRKYADATNLKTTIALIKKDLENIDIKHNKKFYLYELLKKYGPTENTPNNLVCTAAQYILDELIKQDLFYKPWE